VLLTLEGHNETVTSVTFGPDNKKLASADVNGIIKIWDGGR
jgi:WD40 repeat protein